LKALRTPETCACEPRHDHDRASWKSLLALGISGGLLPCPEALMVLLLTHRVLLGNLPRLLPVASALVIVVAGSVITVQALPQVL
jgi:nickel/cobalt transporter (NicO) family protein